MKKSMVDVAFDLMTKKKKPVVFLKLWQEVSEIMGFTVAQEEDNIAQFYSDLSLDDRFVNVAENKWDLRSRHTYDESVVDPASIMIDEDSDDGYTAMMMSRKIKKKCNITIQTAASLRLPSFLFAYGLLRSPERSRKDKIYAVFSVALLNK